MTESLAVSRLRIIDLCRQREAFAKRPYRKVSDLKTERKFSTQRPDPDFENEDLSEVPAAGSHDDDEIAASPLGEGSPEEVVKLFPNVDRADFSARHDRSSLSTNAQTEPDTGLSLWQMMSNPSVTPSVILNLLTLRQRRQEEIGVVEQHQDGLVKREEQRDHLFLVHSDDDSCRTLLHEAANSCCDDERSLSLTRIVLTGMFNDVLSLVQEEEDERGKERKVSRSDCYLTTGEDRKGLFLSEKSQRRALTLLQALILQQSVEDDLSAIDEALFGGCVNTADVLLHTSLFIASILQSYQRQDGLEATKGACDCVSQSLRTLLASDSLSEKETTSRGLGLDTSPSESCGDDGHDESSSRSNSRSNTTCSEDKCSLQTDQEIARQHHRFQPNVIEGTHLLLTAATLDLFSTTLAVL